MFFFATDGSVSRNDCCLCARNSLMYFVNNNKAFSLSLILKSEKYFLFGIKSSNEWKLESLTHHNSWLLFWLRNYYYYYYFFVSFYIRRHFWSRIIRIIVFCVRCCFVLTNSLIFPIVN